MLMSIRGKFLFPLATIFIVVSIMGILFLSNKLQQQYMNELKNKSGILAESVQRSIEIPENPADHQRIIQALGDTTDLVSIFVIDSDSKSIYNSSSNKFRDKSSFGLFDPDLEKLILSVMSDKSTRTLYNDKDKSYTIVASTYYMTDFKALSVTPGVVLIIVDGKNLHSEMLQTLITYSVSLVLSFLLIISIFYYLANVVVIKPLDSIAKVSQQRIAGDVLVRAPVTSSDEIGLLARGFNNMLDQVNSEQDKSQKALTQLAEKEFRLKMALEAGKDSIIDYDIQNNTFFFSKNWYLLIADESKTSINSLDEWLVHVVADDAHKLKRGWLDLLQGDSSMLEIEYRIRSEENQIVWVLLKCQLVKSSIDQLSSRIIGTQADITQKKKAESLKNEFISTVSHELRTPLTSIRGSLKLILSMFKVNLDDKASNLLEIAYRNTDRLLFLINDILDVQKLESGEMRFSFEKIDVVKFLEETISANQAYGEEFDINYVLKINDKSFEAEFDKQRIAQSVINLMSNAAKFSGDSSEVIIELKDQSDAEFQIIIQDYGIGISESFLPILFDKFTQVDGSNTKTVKGAGLGLTISKEIIELHGGNIQCESELNKGTRFTITLPKIQHPNLQ